MGVVEAPRHEAPLCPVPPRTRGVTTIAPVERGRNLSSSHAEEAEVDPLKPQGKKELRAAMCPNPNAVGSPRKVPAQLLPPHSHTAQTKLSALLPKTAKATGKILLPKNKALGLLEDPPFGQLPVEAGRGPEGPSGHAVTSMFPPNSTIYSTSHQWGFVLRGKTKKTRLKHYQHLQAVSPLLPPLP